MPLDGSVGDDRTPEVRDGRARPLAIVLYGGVVQSVYAERGRPLRVRLLDDDDLQDDDSFARPSKRPARGQP